MGRRTFGTVVYRGDRRGGCYYIQVTDPLTRRRYHRAAGRTARVADRRLARLQGLLEIGRPFEEALAEACGRATGRTMSFMDAAAIYLQRAQPDLRPATFRGYQSVLRIACKADWTKKPLAQIRPHDLTRWITERRSPRAEEDKGLEPSTCNRFLSSVSSVFRLMVRLGYAAENPVRNVQRYSEQGRERTEHLTKEEAAGLLATCEPVLREAVDTAVHCGLRRGELLALRWRHVDFPGEQLIVEAASAKSKKARPIPIPKPLVRNLLRLREARKVLRPDGEDPVFAWPDGRSLTVDLFNSRFRRAVALCKEIPAEKKSLITPHTLRRTFATLGVRRTGNIHAVSRLLGHSSVDLTARHYARFAPSDGRFVVEEVARAIAEPSLSETRATGAS